MAEELSIDELIQQESELEKKKVQTLKHFFTAVWGHDPARVFISIPKTTGGMDDHAFDWPQDFTRMYNLVEDESYYKDVYMSPGRFRVGVERRLESNIQSVHSAWVDLDDNKISNAEDFITGLGGFLVNSGSDNHFHGYIPLDSGVDPTTAKAINTLLKKKLGGDHKEAANSLLRVPFTYNHKHYDEDQVPNTVDLEFVQADYPRANVEVVKNLLGVGETATETVEDFDLTPENVDNIPESIQMILAQTVEEAQEAYGEGRSGAFYHLVTSCLEEGLTGGQIYALASEWEVVTSKYKSKRRRQEELQRILKKHYVVEKVLSATEGFKLTFLDETDNRPPTPFLVQNVIPESGFTLLTGLSGSGKSFISVDISLSVAHGREWAGKKVQKGRVLYVAMEGQNGVIQRSKAWHKVNNLDYTRDYAVVEHNFTLHDKAKVAALKKTVENFQPILIVVDTVSHAMVGWDENKASEMNEFINRLMELKSIHGSTILLVHHQAKDTSNDHQKSRGSNSLPAAADASFNTSKRVNSRYIEVKCLKQKDVEFPSTMEFFLESVQFDEVDAFGDPVLDPAVSVFQGLKAKNSSDRKDDAKEKAIVRMAASSSEVYEALKAYTLGPVSKSYILKTVMNLSGPKFSNCLPVWDEMRDRGIIVPMGKTANGRGDKFALAPEHASLYADWQADMMDMDTDPEDEDTE